MNDVAIVVENASKVFRKEKHWKLLKKETAMQLKSTPSVLENCIEMASKNITERSKT